MKFSTQTLTRGAVIAAVYTALTLLLAPISYGALQLRVSEALTLLPLLLPEAVPALAVGCLLSNLLGGAMLPDILFGTLATLLAAVCTYALRKKPWVAALPPVLFNGLIVGTVVHVCYTPEVALPLCMLYVALGQAIAVYGLGMLLLKGLRRVPGRFLGK